MTKTAIFGGTFDPFGSHHEAIVSNLVADGFDVLVPVAAQNPFKEASIASFEDRVQMAQLSLKSVYPVARVLTIERELQALHDGKAVRTHMTVDALSNVLESPPVIAVGSDLEEQLPSWERYEYLKETYGFHIIPDGVVGRKLDPRTLKRREGDGEPVHSSDIRRKISQGEPWEHHVNPLVADYIKTNGLYGAT